MCSGQDRVLSRYKKWLNNMIQRNINAFYLKLKCKTYFKLTNPIQIFILEEKIYISCLIPYIGHRHHIIYFTIFL